MKSHIFVFRFGLPKNHQDSTQWIIMYKDPFHTEGLHIVAFWRKRNEVINVFSSAFDWDDDHDIDDSQISVETTTATSPNSEFRECNWTKLSYFWHAIPWKWLQGKWSFFWGGSNGSMYCCVHHSHIPLANFTERKPSRSYSYDAFVRYIHIYYIDIDGHSLARAWVRIARTVHLIVSVG